MAANSIDEVIDSIRTKLRAEVDAQLAAFAERQAAEEAAVRAAAEAAARAQAAADAAARAAAEAALQPERLLAAFREIDAASSISGILDAIGRTASALAPGAALYVAAGARTERWPVGTAGEPRHESVVADAMRTGRGVRADDGVVVPLVLDGSAVGAVVAGRTGPGAPADSIETLVRYGAARLGYVTAVRTGHAHRWIAGVTALQS
jgi:hypothetical protein